MRMLTTVFLLALTSVAHAEQKTLQWEHNVGSAPLTGYVIWLDGVEVLRTATTDKQAQVDVPPAGGRFEVSAYGINPDGGGELHSDKSAPGCVSSRPDKIEIILTFTSSES